MIDTNELREKLRYVQNGELQPTVEGVQALKDVVRAVPTLLDEVDGLRTSLLSGAINSDIVKAYDGSALERADNYIERLEADNARLTAELTAMRERFVAAEGDIPHICHMCANSFCNIGEACNLAHYVPGDIYCQSWVWRGPQGQKGIKQ